MAAFDQGQVPTIACINKATVSFSVRFDELVSTLQEFLDSHFVPVWGTPARLTVSDRFVTGGWAMAFLDSADVQNALGYHDLTPDGLPLSKVFVKTTIASGGKVSVTASHELAEMLVDPAINLCATGPKNLIYAYEMADPVEEESFSIGEISMSDFVYPSYFEGFRKPRSTRFDAMKLLTKPFQLLKADTRLYSRTVDGRRSSAPPRRRSDSGERISEAIGASTGGVVWQPCRGPIEQESKRGELDFEISLSESPVGGGNAKSGVPTASGVRCCLGIFS